MRARRAAGGVALVLALACAGCSSSTSSRTPPVPSFKVGVTVSGLSGTGLVLRNNGTDDLAVAADGTYRFATAIATGKSYSVTVRAQPSTPAQECTVSDGAGAMGSADVTSISVTCTTRSFALKAVVTGLEGTGLLLRANGTDDLTITADGSHTFGTPVASGASYAVTVAQMPTAPAQICQVTAGASGTVGDTDVTDITVVCSDRAFSVGGSVSGLLGSGLMLRLNRHDLSIAADGAFTFPTPVVSGGAYSVTVQAQPRGPAQSCTVTNGSGIVGSGDITTVEVACGAARPFLVRATVNGLKKPGLVLQNNGADDLTVVGNGAVFFADPVPAGSTYAVTIASVPPGTICEVEHGSGTMGDGDVGDVVVQCHGWGSPQLVAIVNARDPYYPYPHVAVDGAGNVTAAWFQRDGTMNNALASRYVPGSGWGTPQLLGVNLRNYSSVRLGMDSAGNALAVWSQGNASGYQTYASRYTAGSGWGAAQLIGGDSLGSSELQQLAVDPSTGNALAMWRAQWYAPNATSAVWASAYRAGVGWGAAQRLWLSGDPGPGNLQVVVDRSGNFWVTWQDAGMYVNRYSFESGWQTEELVGTYPGNNWSGYPQLAFDSHGDGMVTSIWYSQSGTAGVKAKRYTLGTGWAATEDTLASGLSDYARQPQLVVDAAGNFLMFWQTGTALASNRYTVGQGWSAPEYIPAQLNTAMPNSSLATDAAGNAMAVWAAGNPAHIWWARYAAGHGWGAPSVIEDDATTALNPQVVVDSSGNATAIWSSLDGARFLIWSSRFE